MDGVPSGITFYTPEQKHTKIFVIIAFGNTNAVFQVFSSFE
jgi:hypothetical protein